MAESRVVPSQGSGTVMRSTSTPRDDSTSNTSNLHPTNPLPSRPGGTTAPRGLPSREQAQGYSPLANSLEHPKSWRAATNFPARATPPETRQVPRRSLPPAPASPATNTPPSTPTPLGPTLAGSGTLKKEVRYLKPSENKQEWSEEDDPCVCSADHMGTKPDHSTAARTWPPRSF